MYSFSFLTNWSIQFYSALMFVLHWHLNSKEFQFIKNIYIKRYFAWNVGFRVLTLQKYFSQNIVLICCVIFSEDMVICLRLKHVSLGFNMYHLSFYHLFHHLLFFINPDHTWKKWNQMDKVYWRKIVTKLYLLAHHLGWRP